MHEACIYSSPLVTMFTCQEYPSGVFLLCWVVDKSSKEEWCVHLCIDKESIVSAAGLIMIKLMCWFHAFNSSYSYTHAALIIIAWAIWELEKNVNFSSYDDVYLQFICNTHLYNMMQVCQQWATTSCTWSGFFHHPLLGSIPGPLIAGALFDSSFLLRKRSVHVVW